MTASETCSFTWIALFNICFSFTAWKVSKFGVFSGPYFPVLVLNTKIYYLDTFYAVLLYHNLQFRLPLLPSLLLILLQSEAVVRCCSAKKVFFQISQNSQENTKKEIPAQMFSCEFCEISHNIFFKERFGRLLQHKHSLCLLSHLHSKTMSHIFPGWIFFRFNL